MIHVTVDNYEQEVNASDKPVLIKFFATWCGPCQEMVPLVEELSAKHKEKVKVVEVDINECEVISAQFDITVVPTFVLIKNGASVGRVTGMIDQKELEDFMLQ